MSLGELARGARLVGFGNSLRAVGYAVRRYRDEVVQGRPVPGWMGVARLGPELLTTRLSGVVRGPGQLCGHHPRPGGARFVFDRATLDVVHLAAGGVFVGWDAAPLPSYAVAAAGLDPLPGAVVAERAGAWSVRGDSLDVRVDTAGGLSFADRGAAVVRRDAPPAWTRDGWRHDSRLDPDARVFGLGGRTARVDRRPGRYRMWNTEPGGSYGRGRDPLSICVPLTLTVADAGSHLTFYDNSHDGTVDVGEHAIGTALSGGPLRYYVFPGPPPAALDAYTALTGRPALPPRWALGFHQSRWGYGSQAALEEVLADFDRLDLPVSGLWLDIDHLAGRQPFTVDSRRYPDLAGLATRMAARDMHLVAIVDPGIPPVPAGGHGGGYGAGYDDGAGSGGAYQTGVAADAFCRGADGRPVRGVVWPGTVVYPDFTAPRTRDWWGGRYADLLDRGVSGFWHDMNEPSVFAAFGEPTLPRSTRHDLDGRGGDHREAHNLYGLLMNRAGYEGLARREPARRPYLVSRSGWAGLQRYAGTWTGDIETSWEGLRVSLAFTLGLGLTGIPYSGPDIGGFTRNPSTELFVRWFELAAHLPFFRTHSMAGLRPREPWCFGPAALRALRGVLAERYRLLPYWYTLAWEAHRTGAPYVRPLWWSTDPAEVPDPALRDVDDAFLLGAAYLVAPVLVAGARTRTVRLPAGRWHDRATGRPYDGPTVVTVPAPLDRTPVFARAGAVVPVAAGADHRRAEVALEAYPPAPGTQGTGSLILDAGDGYDEPRTLEFRTRLGPGGDPVLDVQGPAGAAPSGPVPPVRWL